TAALIYADASTRQVKIAKAITDNLTKNLETWAREQDPENVEERTQDLLVEAAAVVASYNMVSRFLVALDVAGMSDDAVPWPVERKEASSVLVVLQFDLCQRMSRNSASSQSQKASIGYTP
ncbi:hypothetical protein DXG03_007244, partial [Asterophora parasitica]